MNKYDYTYSDVTKHLMRKQHIKDGLGFLAVMIVVFLAVMYLR
jgi:hypothetical protein